jgi:hypothetical protein
MVAWFIGHNVQRQPASKATTIEKCSLLALAEFLYVSSLCLCLHGLCGVPKRLQCRDHFGRVH